LRHIQFVLGVNVRVQRNSSHAVLPLNHYHYATKNFLCWGWDVFWIIFGRWIRICRLVSPAVSILGYLQYYIYFSLNI